MTDDPNDPQRSTKEIRKVSYGIAIGLIVVIAAIVLLAIYGLATTGNQPADVNMENEGAQAQDAGAELETIELGAEGEMSL